MTRRSDESLPRSLATHLRGAVILVIIITGLLVIIAALLIAVFNPELFAALLEKVFTITMDVMRALIRL